MLWDGIKVGFKKKKFFFFQAKQSVSDVAMQEPVWTAPHYEISPSLVSTAPSIAPASGS